MNVYRVCLTITSIHAEKAEKINVCIRNEKHTKFFR